MSDDAPVQPPHRPATARPRSDAGGEVQPPTAAELTAIERQHSQLSEQAGATITRDDELGVTWARFGRGPALDYAASPDWPSHEHAARLARLVARMRAADAWPTLIVEDNSVERAELRLVLESAGWLPVATERIMFTRHAAVVPHLDAELRVEAVTPASAADCVRLETHVFGLPTEHVTRRIQRLTDDVHSGRVRAFVLRLVREPLASARLTPGRGVAALSAVGVAERHRRRGYGRMITAVASRAGLATGHKLVWLSVEEANPAAVSLYRGLGFEPSFAWSRWISPA